MTTIYVMALEPIESRYTCQWLDGIPNLLNEKARKKKDTFNIINVVGTQVVSKTSTGAFLNFSATNIWKNTQINTIAEYFQRGQIQAGDKFLFTDAWHTGIIQVKYMSELMDIPVEIHSMWHAGSYDPEDFLGRKIKDKQWSLAFEQSIFHASNYNYFATNFHLNMFFNTIFPELKDKLVRSGKFYNIKLRHKAIRSGQPHNELMKQLEPYANVQKRNLILFPHRVAPEKQPEIFRDLAKALPEYEFIICQEQNLTKKEYHQLMGEAKVMFSANLQETLGISAMEAILCNTIPLVPDRLSYSEMYFNHFKYPSEWTSNWDGYLKNKDKVVGWIRNAIEEYDAYLHTVGLQKERLKDAYLGAGNMLEKLFNIDN